MMLKIEYSILSFEFGNITNIFTKSNHLRNMQLKKL